MKVYHIAIVSKDLSDNVCQRSAFTSAVREVAINSAIAARDEWHKKGNGPYKIYAGTIDFEIVLPPPVVSYSEVKLK